MTGMPWRLRLLFAGAFAVLPLVAAVAVMRPTLALMGVLAPIIVLTAARSIAYPVALGGVPTLVIALLGHNPFPHGLITIAFFGWTGLAVLFVAIGDSSRLPLSLLGAGAVIGSLFFAIELLARLPDSTAPSYGSSKLKLFVLTNLIAVVAGFLISEGRKDFDIYVSLTVAIAGASALILLWRLAQGQAQALFDSRYSLSAEENPIQLGREAADGMLFATYVLLVGGRSRGRVVATILLPLLVISLLAAGSRGPVLGALAGMLVLFAILARNAEARKRLLLLALAGLGAIVLATQLVPGQSIHRSLGFLSGGGSGISSNGRYQLWSEAWHLFANHPLFGVGTGSFFGFDGLNQYPHNLILETGAELGFVGLALLAVVVGSTGLAIARAGTRLGPPGRPIVAVVAAVFVAAFVNAMFSGDVTTNSELWLAAGLGLGLTRRNPEPAPASD